MPGERLGRDVQVGGQEHAVALDRLARKGALQPDLAGGAQPDAQQVGSAEEPVRLLGVAPQRARSREALDPGIVHVEARDT